MVLTVSCEHLMAEIRHIFYAQKYAWVGGQFVMCMCSFIFLLLVLFPSFLLTLFADCTLLLTSARTSPQKIFL